MCTLLVMYGWVTLTVMSPVVAEEVLLMVVEFMMLTPTLINASLIWARFRLQGTRSLEVKVNLEASAGVFELLEERSSVAATEMDSRGSQDDLICPGTQHNPIVWPFASNKRSQGELAVL